MDRRIEPRIWTRKRVVWLLALAALAAGGAALLSYLSTPRQRVERDKLTIDTVERGVFQEYVLPPARLRAGETGLEVRAAVDVFDVPRVHTGQPGTAEIGGAHHPLEIIRIGPAGPRSADVDLRFTGAVPPGLAPDQAVSLRLDLGEPAEALLLRRGAFFQETGGHWVFRLDAAGGHAVRQPVRLGRQNPDVHEVLSGLAPGDRVIISTYSHLTEAQELVLTGD